MGATALMGDRHLVGVPENDNGLNLLRLSVAGIKIQEKEC